MNAADDDFDDCDDFNDECDDDFKDVFNKPSSPQPLDYSLSLPADCAGLRLDAALARLLPEFSRSRLQAWLKAGQIHIDGATATAKQRVRGGERVTLAVLPAPTFESAAEAIALAIVYEDEALLVVDKPAGLVVHPGHGHATGTLMNALIHHAAALADLPRAGIVHRLDKDTSGLLVVAKTLAAQNALVRQLQARTVHRHYLALVHGALATAGAIDAALGRHPTVRTKMAVVRRGGKPARTHYLPREHFTASTLLECRLETGRTHQIRVHLASIGHPLVGDPVYGRRKCGHALLDAFPRQALHATQLTLVHPLTQREMTWHSPLPADFATLLEALRGA